MGMAAVADDFPIDIPDPERGSYQPRLAVVVWGHAVIDMGHGSGAIGNA